MGHNVVPNDTPEKAKARQELSALLNKSDFAISDDFNDPKHFAKIIKKALEGGFTEDQLSRLSGVDSTGVVGGWAIGSLTPSDGWQVNIVASIKGELARFETAAGYD